MAILVSSHRERNMTSLLQYRDPLIGILDYIAEVGVVVILVFFTYDTSANFERNARTLVIS